MTMELKVVDAFTDQPFAGNPAAIAAIRLQASPSTRFVSSLAALRVALLNRDSNICMLFLVRWLSSSSNDRCCVSACRRSLMSASMLIAPSTLTFVVWTGSNW